MRLLHFFLPALLLCPALAAQNDGDLLTRIEHGLIDAKKLDQPGLALEHGATDPMKVIAALLAKPRNSQWESLISALEAQMALVNQRALSALDGARAKALGAALHVERVLLDTHSSKRWHALGFALRADHALRGLVYAADSAEKYEILRSILEQLPNYWQAAERSLISPHREWNLLGAERLALVNELVHSQIDKDTSRFFDRDTQLRWKAIAQRAEKSGREFEARLRMPPTEASSAPAKLGPAGWLRLIQAASGSQLELTKLKWRTLNFIADSEQKLGRVWRSKRPGEPVAEPEKYIASLSAAANAFLASGEMLGGFRLPMVNAQFIERKAQTAPLQRVNALHPKGQLRLFLDPDLRGADQALLTAITLSEALPQAWFPGQTAFRQTRALSEGWSLYAIDWPLRIDWKDNRLREVPNMPATAAHLQVIEAARLLAAMELHAEYFSNIEASELFKQRTGLSMARAQREILAARLDPLYGAGFLVWTELVALEKELGSGKTGIRKCLNLCTSQPQLRPRDILEAFTSSQNSED